MRDIQESLREPLPQDRLDMIPRQAGALAMSAESASEHQAVLQLLQDGFAETANQGYLGRLRMGPFWSHFHQSWVQADQAMRALHPGLDASFLAADTYYTKPCKR